MRWDNHMRNDIKIGAKIRQYRLSNKMSMKELAECANITQSMLSQIERILQIHLLLLYD